MKKIITLFIIISVILAGCSGKPKENEMLIGYALDYIEKSNNGITTYKINDKEYKYRIIVIGRSNNAKYESYYIVLSNEENISFEILDRRFWSSSMPLQEEFIIIEFGLIDQ
ncbi:MAG: hypothetical protein FWG91_07850 [Lachnospiraceae bacterium]|nr:hypothetical protein [Lachnospiraceae bacterium]